MRCACPHCGAFMEHAETSASCVCPQCLSRCSACLGAGTLWTREELERLKTVPEGESFILERELLSAPAAEGPLREPDPPFPGEDGGE